MGRRLCVDEIAEGDNRLLKGIPSVVVDDLHVIYTTFPGFLKRGEGGVFLISLFFCSCQRGMVSVAEFVWSRLSFLIREKIRFFFPFVSGVLFVRREENQDESCWPLV